MTIRLFRVLSRASTVLIMAGSLCACGDDRHDDSAPQAPDSSVATGDDTDGGHGGAGIDLDGGPLDGRIADASSHLSDGGDQDARIADAGNRGDGSAAGPADGGDASAQDAGSMSGSGSTPKTCLSTASLTPGETTRTIQVGAVSRTYLLHVPPSYTGKTPAPLVLEWHGLLLDGSLQRGLFSGYPALSDREGFIVAYPNGIDAAWNVGPCCTTSRDVDDVGFARALVAEIEKLGCIDPKRVYSVGFSMGGGMTYNLACNAGDLFAAMAPAAFDLLAEDEQPCHPSRPITVISFRGRDDFIVPYEGGASTPPNGLPVTIHFRGAQATFDFWKEANGCTGSPTSSDGCETYSSCAAGVQTTLCSSEGLGGHLPGDAELGWATLKRYTLP